MLRHTLLLLVLYGIKSSTGRPQTDIAEAREEIQRDRIKESEVGANGSPGIIVAGNFRNPVIEYLLKEDTRRRDTVREIRHGQTLLVPRGGLLAAPVSVPTLKKEQKPSRDPQKSPITNFFDYVGKFVTSPVLQLNGTENTGDWTKTETFPAMGIIVSTYGADGTLKSSKLHFRPSGIPGALHYGAAQTTGVDHRINWPFAGYFPIVVNDPFLAAYNGITSGMYNTFSQMIEYGPDADICRKKEERYREEGRELKEVTLDAEVKLVRPKAEPKRRKRETTGIELSFRNGDRVNVEVEEPKSSRRGTGRPSLVLRKGGIAIAGPGGAATAYTGGTAIVGPYGTVYKSPEGTAIVGPHSRVVNITDDMTFEDILRLHQQQRSMQNGRAASARKFKNYKNYFSYISDLPIRIRSEERGDASGRVVPLPVADLIRSVQEAAREEAERDASPEERSAAADETLLVFRPKARAEAGRKGVALSAPVSHAVVAADQKVRIRFQPESVATAGPGGFAHAHSDLFLSYLRRR
ncbi:UNVERIFIED_CONTAM: hypothetical protein PYX00_008960 [Menopon gallinae]|uniref:DUF4774 domain-containing protein n=1 Tax=Menopon gallinae TaxID=328185 RepID=A0AAW2H9U8_9NEOP